MSVQHKPAAAWSRDSLTAWQWMAEKTEPLVVRIQSADPEPNHEEENDIAEAKSARVAFHRIKERMRV